MRTRIRAFGIELIGWGLLALALILVLLPIVPTLLLLGALLILSSRYAWASRLLEKTRRLVSSIPRLQRKSAA
jgi:hypothetical protein